MTFLGLAYRFTEQLINKMHLYIGSLQTLLLTIPANYTKKVQLQIQLLSWFCPHFLEVSHSPSVSTMKAR